MELKNLRYFSRSGHFEVSVHSVDLVLSEIFACEVKDILKIIEVENIEATDLMSWFR